VELKYLGELKNNEHRRGGCTEYRNCAVTTTESLDWDDVSALMSHTFRKMKVDASEQPLLMTEPALWSRTERENMARMVFEEFEVPQFFVAVQGALALYATGRTSGVVLDCGELDCSAVPVEDGSVVADRVHKYEVGGRQLTEHLRNLLGLRGWRMESSSEREITRQIKETLCYVAADPKAELEENFHGNHFRLPDGQVITLSTECHICPEPLFSHSGGSKLWNSVSGGSLTDAVLSSLRWTDKSPRGVQCDVILAGGNSLFPGFVGRLRNKLSEALPVGSNLRIIAHSGRQFAAWRGCNILASMESFQRMWIHQCEYEENGPSVVNRRCY